MPEGIPIIWSCVFDRCFSHSAREYLTGFHKRNVQKKEVKKQKAIERQRQERLELRKQVQTCSIRLFLSEIRNNTSFQHRRDLAERAAENAKAVETALGMVQSISLNELFLL